MKQLLLIVLATLALAFSVEAQAFTLSWDPNPVTDVVTAYNAYEKVGTNYTLLGSTNSTTTTFSLGTPASGVHVYAVTAVNLRGESSKSNEAVLPALSTPPKNLKIVIP